MITASITLRDAFDQHYRRQKMLLPARDTIRKWHQALNWWNTELNRKALVADITQANIDRIAGRLAARGIGERSQKSFRRHTLTLWWFCQSVGACSNAPKRRRRGRKRTRPIIPPKPPRDPNNWTNRLKAMPKRLKKRRLITIPQAVVEEMLPTARLDDLVNAYILRKLRGANPKTIDKYNYAVDELEFFLDRFATIADLTNENIENVMWQVRENGRSIPTANNYRKNLISLWNFAAKRGVLKIFPDVDKMIEPTRVPIAWSEDELARLWTACLKQEGTIADIPAADWLIALHGVLWDTGERIGAVLSARWDLLDAAGRLTIKAECRKGKTEDRSSLLHPDTLMTLFRIRKPRRELIFPIDFTFGTLLAKYRRLLKSGDPPLPTDRAHMFHCMRKSSASWFKAAGGNPTELLGHADEATTKVYLAPSIVQKQQASTLLFRPGETRPARIAHEGKRK